MYKKFSYSKTRLLSKTLFTFVLFFSVSFGHGQVVINELMASNDITVFDEQGEYDDWLELYNTTSSNIDISGMHLTDDLSELTKWTIPAGTEIPPYGFLLLWADRNEADGSLHTNFKLNANGEHLALVSSDGTTILDDIVFSTQITDISFGRFPDGGENWHYLTVPSPEFENYESELIGISSTPLFSNAAGYYMENLLLELSSETTEGTIYYTRDGSTPTPNDFPYTAPFHIFTGSDSIEVIKARTFRDGYFPSGTVTNTYLLNPAFNLPVISLSTDPANFFDEEIGIYVTGNEAQENFPYWGSNFWSDCPHSDRRRYNCDNWERPVHIEFFEPDGSLGFGVDAGARIHGKWMRGLPQKTIAIIARDQYGDSEINYPIFPNVPINEFQAILLRSSGNDWSSTMIRDALASSLGESRDLDVMAYRPSILFINGEYWGIHNIREKINEHFIRSHHAIPIEGMDIIENSYGTWPNYGTMENYDYMRDFLNSHNIENDANYAMAADLIDIDEFINYTIMETYASNWDWIGGNCKRWYAPGQKWRWILNDLDAGFNQYPGQMHPPEENMFDNNSLTGFREYQKLKQNEQFQFKFINTFADHLNTIFEPEYFISVIDSLRAIIEPEMPRHVERWRNTFIPGESWIGDGINSMEEWDYELQRLYDFATIRESHAWGFIENEFSLEGTSPLEFTNDNTAGYIRLNTILLQDFSWQGRYFNGIPVEIEALPHENYAFSHWVIDGETYSENPLSITPSESVPIQPVYEYSPGSGVPRNTIVINEINYNSENDFSPGDWVELYNNTDSTFDISNWRFLDEDDSHVFSFGTGTYLAPEEYLVLCRDTVQFKSLFPYIDNYIGNMDFGLSSGGELIRLLDNTTQNQYIDSLRYDDTAPWPTAPDGDGPTLALRNPNLENSLAENWEASLGHGTPGTLNDVYTGINEKENAGIVPDEVQVYQNYPNPFNPLTNISYSLPEESDVNVTIYDISGRAIITLVNTHQSAGTYAIQWETTNLDHQMGTGLYFCRLLSGDYNKTIKMVYLK
ncbi:MAG: T9SS type A sorting domain-containing protein [Candidatus Marinimicrobia bacterium]|nr:T9SS type A sorting domain-containing protein [Candidatus Neomarinimicrobiota bacterium]